MNKITSFPHTLSLCSKKAESKVKRVKSYYCTRVCPKHTKYFKHTCMGCQSCSGRLGLLKETLKASQEGLEGASEGLQGGLRRGFLILKG